MKRKRDEGEGESKRKKIKVEAPSDLGLCVIAKPLAEQKLEKKIYKILEKGAKYKRLRRGKKEIQKGLRRKEKGLLVLAGDVSPIDVVSHLPIVCENQGIPYIWVRSKLELGTSSGTKRPTSCVLVVRGAGEEKFTSKFDELIGLIAAA